MSMKFQTILSAPSFIRWNSLLAMICAMVIIVAACTSGCSDQSGNTLILQREWIPNAEYIGDVLAERLSLNSSVRIELRPGGETLDPIAEVSAGRADIGVASADRILTENEKGANFVILAAATAKSPVTFAYMADEHIISPRDFVGRSVGIQKGTNTELVLYALLKENDVDVNQIKVLESGWDTMAFVARKIDIQGVFTYDEPINLRADSVNIKELYPLQHGVDFVGTVYFINKRLLESRPNDVQTFMSLLVAGWRQALSEQPIAESVRLMKERFPEIEQHKTELSFEAGKPYFEGDHWTDLKKPLYVSQDRWDKMAKTLMSMGKLKKFSFSENVDYSYLDVAASALK